MAEAISEKTIEIPSSGFDKFKKQIREFIGPGEGRFGVKKTDKQLEHELHIPNGELNLKLNGNSTSWSLQFTERLKRIWTGFQEKIDLPSEEEKIKQDILTDARNGILELSKKLEISENRIIAAASGSDAILAGEELLGIFTSSVGTSETGSDISKGLAKTGEYLEIELRDIDNNLISEKILFEKWKEKIDSRPNSYFIITLVSKTGTYYPELTTKILDYLKDNNKIAVVDAIQANGRVPKKDVLDYLDHDVCKGIIISGSKVFKASDHAGFLITDENGPKLINQNINSDKKAQELVDKYGVFGSILDKHNVNYVNNLTELVRVADNAFAIVEGIDSDILYGPKAIKCAAIYKKVLESCGFKIIHDDGFKKVVSIISMEKPGLDPLKIHSFLTELARGLGFTLGGPMQRRGGNPIFRFGLDRDMVRTVNLNTLENEVVKDLNKKAFAEAETNME